MAKAKKTSEQKIAEAFHEVHAKPPSTLGKHQTKTERQAQMTAIALSKAREAGADVPKAPTKKRRS